MTLVKINSFKGFFVTLKLPFTAITFSFLKILSMFITICKSGVLQYDTGQQEFSFIINHLGCMTG